MNMEVRRQERIDMVKERDFRRGELLGKYMAKLLYGWDDKKFEEEYLTKLEKNWNRWKNDRQIDENRHLKRIEEKMEEENKKIRKKIKKKLSLQSLILTNTPVLAFISP